MVSGCGEFTHCEFYCPNLDIYESQHGASRKTLLTGWTYTNFSMCDMMRTRLCLESYVNDQHVYSFHQIDMTTSEYQRFCSWNDTQVKNHCRYNAIDLALQMLPRRLAQRAKDPPVTHPSKLYCSQGVVLALRYAADQEHRTPMGPETFLDKICTALSKIEARSSTPSSVANAIGKVIGTPLPISEPNAHMKWFACLAR
jgi:hypothetical protein